MLFANETVTNAVATEPGVLPPYFWVMLLALVLVAAVAGLLATLGWRVIDWITPGNLNGQLLGTPGDPKAGTPERAPNVALAIVVAAMFLGFSFILGCTVIGVLVH